MWVLTRMVHDTIGGRLVVSIQRAVEVASLGTVSAFG